MAELEVRVRSGRAEAVRGDCDAVGGGIDCGVGEGFCGGIVRGEGVGAMATEEGVVAAVVVPAGAIPQRDNVVAGVLGQRREPETSGLRTCVLQARLKADERCVDADVVPAGETPQRYKIIPSVISPGLITEADGVVSGVAGECESAKAGAHVAGVVAECVIPHAHAVRTGVLLNRPHTEPAPSRRRPRRPAPHIRLIHQIRRRAVVAVDHRLVFLCHLNQRPGVDESLVGDEVRAVAVEGGSPGGVELDTPRVAGQVQPAADVRVGDRAVADLHRVAASADGGVADDRFVGHAVRGGSRG